MEKLVDLNSKSNRKRHYETVIVVSPSLSETQTKDFVTKQLKVLQDQEATILRQDEWGKKRMAYSIKKHAMGQYFYLRYIGTHLAVLALERSLKLDANTLRYLTVRLSDPLSAEEIQTFIERAPREPSACPSARSDEEDFNLEAAYSS